MNTKQESTLVRDLTEPGWREREAERMQLLFAAVPLRAPTGPRIDGPADCGEYGHAEGTCGNAGCLNGVAGPLPEKGWD